MAQLKLLFLDTFAHEAGNVDLNEVNLDLIQFNEVVSVQEIRIIPLGAKIEINPGGARLGATNPTNFYVEAYVNNCNNKSAATFLKIGSMEFHERNIQMLMDFQCPTDCLIIKGYYSAITLAVYGHVMKDIPPHQQPVGKQQQQQMPVQQVQLPKSPEVKHKKEPQLSETKTYSYQSGHTSTAPLKKPHDKANDKAEQIMVKPIVGGPADKADTQAQGVSAPAAGVSAAGVSAAGGGGGNGAMDTDELEYSEEDMLLAGDIITTDETGYDDGYEGYTDINNFNPYQFEVTPLVTFFNPCITEYAQEKLKSADSETLNASAERMLELIDNFTTHPHHDKWVQAMEEIGDLLAVGLSSLSLVDPACFDDTVNVLIEWCLESLNISAAMCQPETPYKVRHLKMGIKFTGQILLLYDGLTTRLLEMEVLRLLFDLFNSPYMATSLRLLIIRTLDLLTQTNCGITWFLGDAPFHQVNQKSGYQHLVDAALNKQNARIMVAMSSLLHKLHIYEMLCKLKNTSDGLAEKTFGVIKQHMSAETAATDATAASDPGSEIDSAATVSYSNFTEQLPAVDGPDIDIIVLCLEEACAVLKHAKDLIAQPAQCSIPSRKQFEVTHPAVDPYPALFNVFSSCKLLEVMFVMLSSPLLATEADIFNAVRELMNELMTTQSGLLFISTNVDTVTCIIRTLLQSAYDKDPDAEDNSAQTLGLTLVYQLQALQYVDQLKEALSQCAAEDPMSVAEESDVLSILHAMLGLTVTAPGRDALVNVLSFDLEPLLVLINPTGEEDVDSKIRSSTAAKYVNDFCQLLLMYTTDISVIQSQLPRLISLTTFEGASKTFGPLMDWLEPFKDVGTLDYSCVGVLAKLFHSYVDQLPKIEVGLVSCLRIMTRLALSPDRSTIEGAYTPEELRYQTTLLELYKEDCLGGWIKIIDKLSDKQLHSWQRGATMPAIDRDLLLFIVQPSLTLMKSIISQVIEARGMGYQDISALVPLYRTFTVLCSVPVGSSNSDIVNQIQKMIIDILAQYTQPHITGTESEINDAMSNSLWTSMVKSLLKFATSHPCNYLSGTLIFSELLPVPLPIQCSEPLSEEEVKLNVNHRTIWSAHLLPIATELEAFIENIAGSSCLHLQHAFRRLCWQLADLNHYFSQFVTKSLLKAFVENLPVAALPQIDPAPGAGGAESADDKDQKVSYEADVVASNTIGILSYLVQQAPAKTALLQSLRIKQDGSCNYQEMFERLLITLNTVSESTSHSQCQENIVSLLQSICDIELSLIDDLDNVDIATQLANELPDKETHEQITLAFMDHIGNYDHCYTSIILSLRTLLMYTDYNYTFNCLTRALLKDSRSLYNLFTRINNTFSKDSSDCISTLSTALQLLRLLVELDDNPNTQRNLTVSAKELALMVNWKVQPHPLDDLEKLLVDLVEESLEGIVTNITSINKLLKSVESSSSSETESMDTTNDESLMQLPEPASVQEQFSKRSVYVVCNVDMVKHSSAYWLTNLMADDSNLDETDERVPSDLVQLCEQYIKDFSLEDQLKKTDAGLDNLSKVTIIHSRKNEVLALGQIGTEFKAPMRGLGVMRRGQQRGRISIRGGRDHFRDRAQNTSRPPSMHVDDFLKIAHTPTSEPQQTSFQPRERGRGNFDRGRGGRTRFPTAPDGFRPNFRGGGGFRGNRGGPRGSPNPRGGYFYNNRGGGGGGGSGGGNSGRFDGENQRFAGGRGGMMNNNMRPDRRNFSPQNSNRYGGSNDSPQSERRSYTARSGMSDGRGGMNRGRGAPAYYNNRDKGQPPSRDRDRPNHYRSYTK